MVEKARRTGGEPQPRGTTAREWEVFVREDPSDPMRHVGSVTAPTADVAHEQAGRLFAWYARDVWVCPADAVRRFSEYSLAGDSATTPADDPDAATTPADGPDAATTDGSNSVAEADEPRVYEDTEGVPRVHER